MPEEINNPQEVPQNGGAAMLNDGNGMHQVQEDIHDVDKLIDDILKVRNTQVPDIERRINILNGLLSDLRSYDALRSSIVDEDGNLKEDGRFGHLVGHPNVVASVYEAKTDGLYQAINDHIVRLERLKQRFGRKSLTMQVFGEAGTGKSTFLQSITNLKNDVIMVAEGDHCTGTTSYIRNRKDSESFEARIYPYTRFELLSIFNKNLEKELAAKRLEIIQIASFDEIGDFCLEDNGLDVTDYSVSEYVTHFSTIVDVLNLCDTEGDIDEENGRKYIKLTQSEDVQQYVAHFNEEGHEYYKCWAVKFVRIFTKFPFEKAGKIELLDSVGLGDQGNNEQVKQDMYQSIADNCDIVTIIHNPFNRGSLKRIADLMDDAHYCKDERGNYVLINGKKKERISSQCLFFVLNNMKIPHKNNTNDCNWAVAEWTNGKFDRGIGVEGVSQRPFHREEKAIIADLHNQNETEHDVLIPILQQVANNLGDIDAKIKEEVNTATIELQQKYEAFLKKVSEALIPAAKGGRRTNFDVRFQKIYEVALRRSIEGLVQQAEGNMNSPAASLRRVLNVKCNADSIQKYMDDIEPDILAINQYSTPAQWALEYENLSSKLAHLIPQKFEDIDYDLGENIAKSKAKIFDSLYNDGRLSVIFKKTGKEEQKDYESSIAWATRLYDIILTEQDYPTLHKLFADLLSFKISIGGLLLFRVVKHFDVFKMNPPKPERLARHQYPAMRDALKRNLEKAFDLIRPEFENFTQAPNEAIYFAIDSFAYGLLHHPEAGRECKNLYEQFEKRVWRDELEQQQAKEVALDEWRNMRDKLTKIAIETL